MQSGTRAMLEAIPRKTVIVEIPEADASFRIREMSGTERDTFEASALKRDEDGKRVVESKFLRARLVSLCLVDDNNVRLYADEEMHQLSDNVSASVLVKLFIAAQELNGMDSSAVDDAEKNSSSVQAGASSSDSLSR